MPPSSHNFVGAGGVTLVAEALTGRVKAFRSVTTGGSELLARLGTFFGARRNGFDRFSNWRRFDAV